jgi:excisionase family DNA binding protein
MPANNGLTVGQAAERLGVTVDTIKRRLKRGEYPDAYREPTPQGFRWKIPANNLDDVDASEQPPDASGAPQGDDQRQQVSQPTQQLIETLQRELEIRNREIERLHVVIVQQAAAIAALPAQVPDRPDVEPASASGNRPPDQDGDHSHDAPVSVWARLWRSLTGRP